MNSALVLFDVAFLLERLAANVTRIVSGVVNSFHVSIQSGLIGEHFVAYVTPYAPDAVSFSVRLFSIEVRVDRCLVSDHVTDFPLLTRHARLQAKTTVSRCHGVRLYHEPSVWAVSPLIPACALFTRA